MKSRIDWEHWRTVTCLCVREWLDAGGWLTVAYSIRLCKNFCENRTKLCKRVIEFKSSHLAAVRMCLCQHAEIHKIKSSSKWIKSSKRTRQACILYRYVYIHVAMRKRCVHFYMKINSFICNLCSFNLHGIIFVRILKMYAQLKRWIRFGVREFIQMKLRFGWC